MGCSSSRDQGDVDTTDKAATARDARARPALLGSACSAPSMTDSQFTGGELTTDTDYCDFANPLQATTLPPRATNDRSACVTAASRSSRYFPSSTKPRDATACAALVRPLAASPASSNMSPASVDIHHPWRLPTAKMSCSAATSPGPRREKSPKRVSFASHDGTSDAAASQTMQQWMRRPLALGGATNQRVYIRNNGLTPPKKTQALPAFGQHH